MRDLSTPGQPIPQPLKITKVEIKIISIDQTGLYLSTVSLLELLLDYLNRLDDVSSCARVKSERREIRKAICLARLKSGHLIFHLGEVDVAVDDRRKSGNVSGDLGDGCCDIGEFSQVVDAG